MGLLQHDSSHLRFKLLMVLCLWISTVKSCEVACFPPSTPAIHNATEELAIAEGRCYTACLERYQDFIPSSSYINYGNWSSVSYVLLESHTCAHLQRVMECKTSCLSRLYTHYETDNLCRDDCDNKCVEECGTGNCTYGTLFTNCSRKCRRPACRIGCEEFSLNFGVNTMGNQPSIPLLPLQLMPSGDAGVYTVQAPIVNSTDSLSSTLSSFVFRVEENGEFDYFWQPSLAEHLQLSAYSCKNVKISYAAVNKYGRSSYSPVNSFCIGGDYYYPQQVTQVNFEYSEDHRPEFVSHAIANISWEKPADFMYLTGYTIAIVPLTGACGGPQGMITIDNIPKNITWIVLRADQPGHLPRFGCTYHVQLRSLPIEPGLPPATKLMRPILTNTVGPLILSCQRTIHLNKTITVDVSWSVDSDDFAISSFNIDIQLMTVDSPSMIPNTLSSSQLPMKANYSSYEFSSGLQSFIEVDRKYVILVTPVKNLSYFWRPIPHQAECIINATISPGPPNKISMDTISVKSNETTSFNASWSSPSPPFGTITAYEILVGKNPLMGNENDTNNFYTTLVSGNTTNVILHSSEIAGQTSCNYLQIRSYNGFAWSNWSSPLSLTGLQLDCMPTTSTPVPSLTTSTLSINPSTLSIATTEHEPALSTTMVSTTPEQTSAVPIDTAVSQNVMYVVYSLSAFTAVLLLLSAVFLVVLVILRYSRIREDKISAVESDPETASLKKVPAAIPNVRKAEENIYDSIPSQRDGDSTADSTSTTKPDFVIVSTSV